MQRLQKQVALDRLLCRLFSGKEIPWVLKGGHALELRIQKSRATKDIDLALKEIKIFHASVGKEQSKLIFEKLQEKATLDLKDFFEYTIGLPVLDLDAAPYGGGRFPVETSIDGKIFIKFHLDIGVGDV
ncbi:MAG: nucleotidyl transferase AbiEii/AbiGii toxin family protein [Deltaproteobacteria bacterium]|nr:nucleotidyl transferase AbiEii/AbiGii toxin family protein [Deltaproteobacteria bacterium]